MFAALWSIAPGKVARPYGGAYVIHISRRVVPSRFYMAFDPVLRVRSGTSLAPQVVAPTRREGQLPVPSTARRPQLTCRLIKRFCKLILTIALLSAAMVGVVALKSAIWISHFSY